MAEEQPGVNINIGGPEKDDDKTETLVCNWCREPHRVTPAYKKEVISRGEKDLRELREKEPEAELVDVEDTWTCGRCTLHLLGLPGFFKTDCHDHAVPEIRKD
jgi:hypothetical protein